MSHTAVVMIPGVEYRVAGPEADRWFARGSVVIFLGQEWIVTDRDLRYLESRFVEKTTATEKVIRGEDQDGFSPLVPRPPSPVHGKDAQYWKQLHTASEGERREAFRRLASLGDPSWHGALPARAPADRAGGKALFEAWVEALFEAWVENPVGAQDTIATLLDGGSLAAERPLRLFMARSGHSYFLPLLETELARGDPAVLRTAIEELETMAPAEGVKHLAPLNRDQL